MKIQMQKRLCRLKRRVICKKINQTDEVTDQKQKHRYNVYIIEEYIIKEKIIINNLLSSINKAYINNL